MSQYYYGNGRKSDIVTESHFPDGTNCCCRKEQVFSTRKNLQKWAHFTDNFTFGLYWLLQLIWQNLKNSRAQSVPSDSKFGWTHETKISPSCQRWAISLTGGSEGVEGRRDECQNKGTAEAYAFSWSWFCCWWPWWGCWCAKHSPKHG